ncbi:iron ABC transporter permease [Pseudoalteromonas sp. Cnat2-41]|uniref:FecCD family ABC transporter permease n=1 Tax=unclassified Pseudoalteromonas TaxID=194690 RepID=UPI001EF84C73|nr:MULTISPECIES: iron ABC transporter permease [unclassified Pseudoalteromonas]MCF2862450.1 iron ABC transporter permease [Pseudoalteromonas sp. CNAT2-18]MCG7557781.1 iron ABC transporter permease [Pseudoalteromonas sp. CNAT2-18.1]
MTVKYVLSLIAVLLVFVLSGLFALKQGAVSLSWPQLLAVLSGEDSDSLWQQIIWQLRSPRVGIAFLAGGGLALAGGILQTVTRNPLADPYLFGISSGAALGVVVTMVLFGVSAPVLLSLSAFAGAMLAVVLLLIVAYSVRYMQNSILVLAGVALSFGFSALTSLLLYFGEPQAVSAVVFWTLGSFSGASMAMLLPVGLLMGVSLVIVWLLRAPLNALLLGDESAHTLGINVPRLRLAMLLLSALITAVLVSVCGGIGFVGLMIPHLVRILAPHAGSYLYPASFFSGGLFMVWVDLAARTVLDNQELPVGVITSAIGSIFFLLLLFSRYRTQ